MELGLFLPTISVLPVTACLIRSSGNRALVMVGSKALRGWQPHPTHMHPGCSLQTPGAHQACPTLGLLLLLFLLLLACSLLHALLRKDSLQLVTVILLRPPRMLRSESVHLDLSFHLGCLFVFVGCSSCGLLTESCPSQPI